MTTQTQGKESGRKKIIDVMKVSLDDTFTKRDSYGKGTMLVSLADPKDPVNAYLMVVFLTGVFQFLYVLLVGTFPFNAFLAGFLSCVTSFVLGVCLKKTGEFKGFLFAHLVLHLAVLMLIG